jgi:hypothetical protein
VVYFTGSEDDSIFEKKYEFVTGQFIGEGIKRSVDYIMEKYNEVMAKSSKELINEEVSFKRKKRLISPKAS